MDKQNQDELGYYTDFEGLEVNLNDDPNELYDSSDDNMVERDHLDITEWCMNLDAIEIIDDMMFNYLED
tara:strand:- start:398 stop:604 length:207 start_codon:yes stop_codon:yes gene_type:complete